MGLELYWYAFFELSTCRSVGFAPGPIPWTAVMDYAQAFGLDDVQTHLLVRFVRAMDGAFLNHHEKQMKSNKVGNTGRKGLFGRGKK